MERRGASGPEAEQHEQNERLVRRLPGVSAPA